MVSSDESEDDDDFECCIIVKPRYESFSQTSSKSTEKETKSLDEQPVDTKRRRVTALDELTRSPPRPIQPPVTTEELTDVILENMDVKEPMNKVVPCVPALLQRQDRAPNVIFTSTRRKMTRPLAVTPLNSIQPRVKSEKVLWDPTTYQHWIGCGASDDGDPTWSIQDWLFKGLKRKKEAEVRIEQ